MRRNGEGKDYLKCARFDDGRKSFFVIDAMLLRKPANNPPS
jgi:hypothetical protein